MGGTSSKQISEKEIEQLKRKYESMEVKVNTSESELKKVIEENAILKRALDEERKANHQSQQEFQMIRNLYDELSEFKGRLERAKRSVEESSNDNEIEQLKHENVELYTKLKNINSNWSISMEKSNELKSYEKELKMQRSEFTDRVNLKLDEVKHKMNDASTKFASVMETALFEMNATLSDSKRELELIEKMPCKNNNSLTYEKIKNILLEQKNSLMREMMNLNIKQQSSSNLTPPTVINNLSKEEEQCKNLNLAIDKNLKELKEGNQNKIIILHAAEDCDDKKKAQLILQKLTQLSVDNINAYRLGKISKRPRPIVVVLENAKQATEILENKYSLQNTEFKGVKIFKFKEDIKNLSKNANANKTNPFCTSESDDSDSDECIEDDKPYKIVLFYVAEDDDDYNKGLSIVKELTSLPLKNVDVSRIGTKTDAKIRPMIISFDSQRYVNEALRNRYSLKDTPFKGVKVVKYREQTKQNDKNVEDVFPF